MLSKVEQGYCDFLLTPLFICSSLNPIVQTVPEFIGNEQLSHHLQVSCTKCPSQMRTVDTNSIKCFARAES
jgi:hypothetical protein